MLRSYPARCLSNSVEHIQSHSLPRPRKKKKKEKEKKGASEQPDTSLPFFAGKKNQDKKKNGNQFLCGKSDISRFFLLSANRPSALAHVESCNLPPNRGCFRLRPTFGIESKDFPPLFLAFLWCAGGGGKKREM